MLSVPGTRSIDKDAGTGLDGGWILTVLEGVRILGFAGSARAGSFNRSLVRIAVRGAGVAGAKVTLVALRDYPLPLDGPVRGRGGQ